MSHEYISYLQNSNNCALSLLAYMNPQMNHVKRARGAISLTEPQTSAGDVHGLLTHLFSIFRILPFLFLLTFSFFSFDS